MSATNENPQDHLSGAGFDASSAALNQLTDQATGYADPLSHIHRTADHDSAHHWLGKLLPSSTLTKLEDRFHLGNYVADRQTGKKTWE